MESLKYIVAGTPRGGTTYFAKFMTSVGIPCGHETIFCIENEQVPFKNKIENINSRHHSLVSVRDFKTKNNLGKWVDEKKIIADSSYMSAPFLTDDIFKETKILHLVRNPIKVISSLVVDLHYFHGHHTWERDHWQRFISRNTKLQEASNAIDRAALFWIQWHEMIAPSADFTHRIEDGPTEKLMDFLKCDLPPDYFNKKDENNWGRRKKDLCANKISADIRKQLIAKAEEYDYEIKIKKLFL